MASTTQAFSPSGAFRIWPAQGHMRLWQGEIVTLLATASPIVLIGILTMAMSIADMVMLGRFDPDGLATIVVVSDLYSIIFNFSAGFASVVTPQVATAIGARVRWRGCTIVRRPLPLFLGLAAAGAGLLAALGWRALGRGFRN
mgnify:CR=1 FL=1